MTRKIFISVIATGLFLTGCSGGGVSSGGNTSVAKGTYTVSAIDDNIIGATVSAPECATFTDKGSGNYTLKECISMPSTITAVGGYIDINGNGIQDANETSQDAPLKLKVSQSGLNNGFMVTPLTTLTTQETNLTALATKLGVSESDLFKDNARNRNLQRSINALLIAARAAGITKYDTFVKDFKNRILASTNTGLSALSDAKNYMDTHSSTYRSTYGITFGGFISDTTGIDLSNGLSALKTAKGTTVPSGKIRLGGFIYDAIIANADITIYDGVTSLATATSDSKGRYSLEIDKALLSQSKVLKIIAISGRIKLIAYITTDELKAGLIGQKLSNAQVEDLIISNVTTAKAVLVDKIAPDARTDAKKMLEAKARVEQLYSNDLVTVAAAIKDVVDNNKTITQTDTTVFAQDIIEVNQTTKVLTTTIPADINSTGTTITTDPLLDEQLNSTQAISQNSLRAIIEGKTLYNLDYWEGTQYPLAYDTEHIKTDGSDISQTFKYNGTEWAVYEDNSGPAGNISWSSDGTKLYGVGDSYPPVKISLLSKESITINGTPIHIYILQEEITAEPTDSFFTNFITTTNNQGSINFTSMNDPDKNMTINYDGNNSSTYILDNDGTYTRSYNNALRYKYRTLVKNGKTYIVFDDGQTNDGGGRIFYLDFANQKVYQKDYHNIGFKDSMIEYDNTKIVDILKNLTPEQKSDLEWKIQEVGIQQNLSAINTQYMANQRVLYQFIKSLAD